MENYINKLNKWLEKTKISNNREDYENYEFDLCNAWIELSIKDNENWNKYRNIDDLKDDKFIDTRKNYSSDAGATKDVNKQFRQKERPVLIEQENIKKRTKQIEWYKRRADVLKSRQIKEMSDAKRQDNFTR